MEKVYDNSLWVNTFRRAKVTIKGYISKKDKGSSPVDVISSSHDESNYEFCDTLPAIENVASALVHDYLSLSKGEDCWPKRIQGSVDLNVSILKEVSDIVQSAGANFKIALVPAGWAFPNQNTFGRMTPQYKISESLSVSQVGVAQKLVNEDFMVIDLEKLLRPYVLGGINNLYFPADGHFTKKSRQIIGDYLIEVLE